MTPKDQIIKITPMGSYKISFRRKYHKYFKYISSVCNMTPILANLVSKYFSAKSKFFCDFLKSPQNTKLFVIKNLRWWKNKKGAYGKVGPTKPFLPTVGDFYICYRKS